MTDVVRLETRGAARELMTDHSGEVVISGPAGTGKSVVCLFRMHLICLLQPGYRGLVLRKTHVSLTATTLVTFKNKVIPGALANGTVTWYGGSGEEPAAYRYSNGSTIVVGGMDKPEKIMSSEYDMIFVDEATELTEQDWEYANTRLRNYVRGWTQLVGACNPNSPTHWMQFRAATGKLRILISRHIDNPAYMRLDGTPTAIGADYFKKLDALTGVRRMRLLEGKWAAAEGIIYSDWDEAKHLINQRPVPDDWPRFWSIDFGYRNPFVCQFWAQDPDGRLILYREIYMTNRIVEDHAKEIMALVSDEDPDYVHPDGEDRYAYHGRIWHEPQPQWIVCDHDAEGRATLERELGLSTEAAFKTVTEGIEAVQVRMKEDRIFIMRDAVVRRDPALLDNKLPTSTQDEIPSYVWAFKANPGGATVERDMPLKLHDHGADAMRYFVAEIDLGVRPNVRWM